MVGGSDTRSSNKILFVQFKDIYANGESDSNGKLDSNQILSERDL